MKCIQMKIEQYEGVIDIDENEDAERGDNEGEKESFSIAKDNIGVFEGDKDTVGVES